MTKIPRKDCRFQARAVEIVFDVLIDGDLILETYKKLKQGLYKGFVKHHKIPNGHTHVGIILREKPKYDYKKLKQIFKVGEVEPTLVNPIGKGNSSPLKKLVKYGRYLTDGHDNGRFEDTWNYKFDLELMGLKKDSYILCKLSRRVTMRQLISESDWELKAYYFKNKSKIDAMVNNWKVFYKEQETYYPLDSYKPEILTMLQKWKPEEQTLILRGPTNLGKTELAKSLLKELTGKNPLFCRNLNKLRYRDDGQPFILDDMEFSSITREAGIHITDTKQDSDIRVLFGIHTVEATTPRIFTTNRIYEDYLPYDQYLAISKRILWVDLEKFGRLY